jgi:hypothetical protein
MTSLLDAACVCELKENISSAVIKYGEEKTDIVWSTLS